MLVPNPLQGASGHGPEPLEVEQGLDERIHKSTSDPRRASSLLRRLKVAVVALIVLCVALIGVVVWLGLSALGDDASAAPPGPPSPPTFVTSVTVDSMMETLQQLQDIANAHNGSRSVTMGYNASADYIVSRLAAGAPGWHVTQQEFTVDVVARETAVLAEVSPQAITFVLGTDYLPLTYEGGGSLTAVSVTPAAQYGCSTTDYADVPSGGIALVLRGVCPFQTKVNAATAHGAGAVLMYNAANKLGPISGTLSSISSIPVFGLTNAVGAALVDLTKVTNVTMTVTSKVSYPTATTRNIIVESDPGASSVVVFGAHLDSVNEGPGINDNGSGSAMILELALQWHKFQGAIGQVKHAVQFCWWSAEEWGLLGSKHYVAQANLSAIVVYMNFDMMGSPNGYPLVQAGTNGVPQALQPATAAVTEMMQGLFNETGVAHATTQFDASSDYRPFLDAGVPVGGAITGNAAYKTMAQRTEFGGLANAPLDPCYHSACDNIENVDKQLLGHMAAVSAQALQRLVQTDLPQ